MYTNTNTHPKLKDEHGEPITYGELWRRVIVEAQNKALNIKGLPMINQSDMFPNSLTGVQ